MTALLRRWAVEALESFLSSQADPWQWRMDGLERIVEAPVRGRL